MEYDIIKLLHLEDYEPLIESIQVTKDENKLNCYISLHRTHQSCPFCGGLELVVHDYRNKTMKHSYSTNTPCFLIYKARRYQCKYCHKIFYELNPFSTHYNKTTHYTRLHILDELKSHTATFTSVADMYKINKMSAIRYFDSYIDCERKDLSSVICIDEFYTSRKSNEKYACVLVDFLSKNIIDIYSSRHKHYLGSKLSLIPKVERDRVKAVVIDMWDSYKILAKIYFKNACIAVDSFHIIQHLNKAIIDIRLRVMRKFDKHTDTLEANDIYYYMLKRFHYFFVKDFESIYTGLIEIRKMKTKWKKEEILKYLLSLDSDLDYAYRLKEKYREFNKAANYETCDEELNELIHQFQDSHIDGYREFGYMIGRWKDEIKNSLITYDGRRLSNGVIEGVNSRIKTILKNANGYTNFRRLRNRIMYSINKNVPIKNKPIKL